MDQPDAINLIKDGVSLLPTHQVWADLGCGKGTFTEALASLLPNQSVIYAIDKNECDLNGIPSEYGNVNIEKVVQDIFKIDLPLNNFDGILMANSLHYIRDKKSYLKKLFNHLTANGLLIILEYEARYSNPWVPYPIGINDLQNVLIEAGFRDVRKLGSVNSRYGHIIYSIGCSM